MTKFPKAVEKRLEYIMYLKVLCNLDGTKIYKRIPKVLMSLSLILVTVTR